MNYFFLYFFFCCVEGPAVFDAGHGSWSEPMNLFALWHYSPLPPLWLALSDYGAVYFVPDLQNTSVVVLSRLLVSQPIHLTFQVFPGLDADCRKMTNVSSTNCVGIFQPKKCLFD